MDKLDQIYKLHMLLRGRRSVISRTDLQDRLDLKRATTTRLLRLCRDVFHMPIEFDRERNGYYYSDQAYELPGLWFNPSELTALMTSHRLLAEVQPGVLEPYLAPLQQRIEELLKHKRAGSKEIFNRVRILPMANRLPRLENFQQASDALVNRQRLRIQYSSRSTEKITERWVSPQRLVYYRDNWYLDGWCHAREALRTFSVDRMNVAETGDLALDISDRQLNEHLTQTFGIFAGPATDKAVIHFSVQAARWVCDEIWHPEQESRLVPDSGGKWELVVPYGDPTELLRDILKFGPDAEVISPPSLRKAVEDQLSAALRQYRRMKKI